MSRVICLHFKGHLRVFYGTCFKGGVTPFLTVSRLLLFPVGCVVVVCTHSVGLVMNFLVKTSQGGISKFIPRSLFFKINKFSHIVIPLLSVKFFNNFSTGFNYGTCFKGRCPHFQPYLDCCCLLYDALLSFLHPLLA